MKEMENLVGKLGRIGQTYRPIYYIMPHLYASVAYALQENKYYMTTTSRRFHQLIKKAKQRGATTEDDQRVVSHAIKAVVKRVHSASYKYRMPDTLNEEIGLLKRMICDKSISLATPIGHFVPRDYAFEAGADACKRSDGGWSTDLSFWWHLPFPAEVVMRTYLPNNKNNDYVSINCLEMVCVVINFAAVIHCCAVDGINLSQYPVLLNWCDNTAATCWANYKCKTSLIGRQLGCLFVGLLMGTKLGIQVKWLPTKLNKIADAISCVDPSKEGLYDYSQLLADFPVLKNCCEFQLSSILRTKIWAVLWKNNSVDPLIIAKLRPLDLGSITSSAI